MAIIFDLELLILKTISLIFLSEPFITIGYFCLLVFQGTYVEGIKEEVVLSPGHALSFIAAGEGACVEIIFIYFLPF